MSETINSYSSPSCYPTTYDVKTGVEIFEAQYRWILNLLEKLMSVWSVPALSICFFH
jgi:hypothetical protein